MSSAIHRRVGSRGVLARPHGRTKRSITRPAVPVWLALALALGFGVALVALVAGARPPAALLTGGLGLAAAIAFHLGLVGSWRAASPRAADATALYALTPAAFERHVSDLFARAGYHVRHVGASGDGGVDVRVQRAGRSGIVQCKRYHAGHAVGPATIRELIGARVQERADEAWLATTGRVTAGARGVAAAAGVRVLDADDLVAWGAKLGRRWREGAARAS